MPFLTAGSNDARLHGLSPLAWHCSEGTFSQDSSDLEMPLAYNDARARLHAPAVPAAFIRAFGGISMYAASVVLPRRASTINIVAS